MLHFLGLICSSLLIVQNDGHQKNVLHIKKILAVAVLSVLTTAWTKVLSYTRVYTKVSKLG
jgi:hypothetical protein